MTEAKEVKTISRKELKKKRAKKNESLHLLKECCKRDLQKRPTKETYERDF